MRGAGGVRFLASRLSARTLLLIGVNVLLLVALGWSLSRPEDPVSGPKSARSTALSASELDIPARTDSLAVVGAQPVFHRTRQFVRLPDLDAPDLRPPPPSYQFAGSMVLPGKAPVAYLRNAQSSQSIRVAVGEIVEGWTVSAIDARSVVLEFSGELVTIGAARAQGSGIVAIAPRAAASEPSSGAGLRELGNPGQRPPANPSTLAVRPVPERKPRTYQPPPPT